jgi:hypothetical protein
VLFIADVIKERNAPLRETKIFTLSSEHIALPVSTEMVLFLKDSGTFINHIFNHTIAVKLMKRRFGALRSLRVFIDENNAQ